MKLFSPVVSLVAIAVAAMAIWLMILDPSRWPWALLSLAFLPLAGGMIYRIARRKTATRRSIIRIRAAMVGAGALLASSLGFVIAEILGWIDPDGDIARNWISVLLVLIVVLGDLVSARMESAADKEQGQDG